ncbi:MAG TPA: hypothetical protein H9796_08600 [Candidatus Butyricimonas faecavium]|nr:hypothetical protein [Candidatus Butyricimonas faecavium]
MTNNIVDVFRSIDPDIHSESKLGDSLFPVLNFKKGCFNGFWLGKSYLVLFLLYGN